MSPPPLRDLASHDAKETGPGEIAAGSFRTTVLIVEDERDIRAILADLLEDEGYSVAQASNGFEALGLLRSGLRPCTILLDLMMPVMNGWTFREQQLCDPELTKIPVAVMTAAGVPADTIRRELATIDVMRKPLSVDEILAVVARAIG